MWRLARPGVAEERWLVLAARYPGLRAGIEEAGRVGEWKTTSWLARCLSFALGLLAAGMFAGVMSLFPAPWLIGGLLLIAAAEWLVAHRRVFRSGIEEAWMACGAMALVAQVLDWSTGNNLAMAVVLIASALLLAGWRLLNPLFTTLAVAGYSLALALFDAGFFGGPMHTLAAALFCITVSVGALLLGAKDWQRPSHDRMIDGLMVTMPWLAFGWLTAYGWQDNGRTVGALLLATGFLAIHLFLGLRRRQLALLWGAMGNLLCVAFALHALLRWPMHWQLIVAGGALLAVALLLDRRLRQRDEGITSRALQKDGTMDLAQLAGVAGITPAPGVAPPADFTGQGGGFGGGGASGRF